MGREGRIGLLSVARLRKLHFPNLELGGGSGDPAPSTQAYCHGTLMGTSQTWNSETESVGRPFEVALFLPATSPSQEHTPLEAVQRPRHLRMGCILSADPAIRGFGVMNTLCSSEYETCPSPAIPELLLLARPWTTKPFHLSSHSIISPTVTFSNTRALIPITPMTPHHIPAHKAAAHSPPTRQLLLYSSDKVRAIQSPLSAASWWWLKQIVCPRHATGRERSALPSRSHANHVIGVTL